MNWSDAICLGVDRFEGASASQTRCGLLRRAPWPLLEQVTECISLTKAGARAFDLNGKGSG